MNLYEELFKVKVAQIDALQNHIMDLEQQIHNLEIVFKGVAKWVESIHGQETMKHVIQDLKKSMKTSLAKTSSNRTRFS